MTAALAVSVGAASAGAATPGQADLNLALAYEPNASFGRPKEFPVGAPGRFSIGFVNDGPDDATTVAVTITLPASARVVSAASACETSGRTLRCVEPGPTRGAGFLFAVASDVTGPLTLTASVTSDQTDPDPSDNQSSVTVEVLAAASDGSGSGTARVRIAGIGLAPAKPRAGRRLAATLRLTGSPRPAGGSVACTARAGGQRLAPVLRRYRNGAAVCAWKLPASTAGTRLVGTISLKVPGGTFRRTFRTSIGGGP